MIELNLSSLSMASSPMCEGLLRTLSKCCTNLSRIWDFSVSTFVSTDKQGKIQVWDHTVSWWIHKTTLCPCYKRRLELLNSSADVCVARYAVQLALLIEKVCDCFNIFVKPVLMFTLDWTEFLLVSCWNLWLHLGDKSVVCTDIRTRHR